MDPSRLSFVTTIQRPGNQKRHLQKCSDVKCRSPLEWRSVQPVCWLESGRDDQEYIFIGDEFIISEELDCLWEHCSVMVQENSPSATNICRQALKIAKYEVDSKCRLKTDLLQKSYKTILKKILKRNSQGTESECFEWPGIRECNEPTKTIIWVLIKPKKIRAYSVIHRYLVLIKDNTYSQMASSLSIVASLLPYSEGRNDHKSRNLRICGVLYINHLKLPISQQGSYVKRKPLINEKDV